MRQRVILVLLGTVLLLVAGASPAGAAPPVGERITRCGQTVTGPTAYLARDLTCATGFTLIGDSDSFEPADLAVDLRGHRFKGRGAGVAFSAVGDGSKPTNLTVTNGRIDHWGTAISGGASGVTVSRVRLDHNNTAVSCVKGGCSVGDSALDHNETGGSLLDATLSFTRTSFTANELGAFGGSSYSSLRVDRSVFANNSVGITTYPNGDTEVTKSVFTGNGVGFEGREGVAAVLTGNRLIGNSDGIYIDSAPAPDSLSYVQLGDNVAHHNKRYGIYAPVATDLGGNRAWRNGEPCVGVICQGRG